MDWLFGITMGLFVIEVGFLSFLLGLGIYYQLVPKQRSSSWLGRNGG
jgi:hypothetical protein